MTLRGHHLLTLCFLATLNGCVVSDAVSGPAANANTSGSDAGPGDHSATLQWAASSTAGVTYSVYRSATPGGPYTQIMTGLSKTSAVDTSVANSTTYYYVVRADDISGESAPSNEVDAVIPAH